MPVRKNDNGLTAKQQRFCDFILLGQNSNTECYKKAGYAGSTETCAVEASKLLNNPNVSFYLTKKRKEIEERTTVTIEYIVKKAKKILESCSQEIPIKETVDEETGEKKTFNAIIDSKGANMALKILGDTIGAFTKNIKLEDKTERTSKIDSLIDNINKKKAAKAKPNADK